MGHIEKRVGDDNSTTTTTPHHTTLNDLLSNTLVVEQIAPYLSLRSRIALTNTSRSLRTLLQSPNVNLWRYLDLSRGAIPVVQGLTKDGARDTFLATKSVSGVHSPSSEDFYDHELQSVFSRTQFKGIIQNVTTLILDGLPVTAEFVHEIIAEPSYNVRILSIRDNVHMNEKTLIQALRYAVRGSRPKGLPKLKGLYFFGPRDSISSPKLSKATSHPPSTGVMSSLGAQIGTDWNHKSLDALSDSLASGKNAWYGQSGRIIKQRSLMSDWSALIQKCEGIIAFDVVLCPSSKHIHTESDYDQHEKNDFDINSLSTKLSEIGMSPTGPNQPEIATIALGSRGCENCGSCPEGFAIWGKSPPNRFPLLAPLPRHSSNVRAARTPHHSDVSVPSIVLRCDSCMKGRWCERCGKWWCETCFITENDTRTAMQKVESLEEMTQTQDSFDIPQELPTKVISVRLDCWECGNTCVECRNSLIRNCQTCRGEYCIKHNDGSTLTDCDWCCVSGPRIRELY